MKIGIAQMNSRTSKGENLNTAKSLITDLAEKGADLVVLPEYFNYIGPESQWPDKAEYISTSTSLEEVRELAIKHRVHIHAGTIMEREADDVFNTSVVISSSGKIIARYRKIHLFDVDVPGARNYQESAYITPGTETATYTIDGITFGMATCYDLRFPELFRKLVADGAQVIVLPAAFTLMTGKDHWELLLRARAVENLCWVAASGQYGHCPPHHTSYGRSMLIDPWGIITAQALDGVGTVIGEVDIERLEQLRGTFPALEHTRSDLF